MMILRAPKFRAGWRSRPETLEGGASKILESLRGFAGCLPELKEWSCEGPPFVPAPLDVKYISAKLGQSAKRVKSPKLGFNYRVWTGTEERAFGLMVNIGQTSRQIPNRVTLTFPPDVWPDVLTAKCLLSTLVRIWEPEFVAYNPAKYGKVHEFELGQLTYLSKGIEALLGDLSRQNIKSEPLESGRLFSLTPSEIERLYLLALHFGPKGC
jgi:hypothetical protein